MPAADSVEQKYPRSYSIRCRSTASVPLATAGNAPVMPAVGGDPMCVTPAAPIHLLKRCMVGGIGNRRSHRGGI
ncbi:MAG: hypothetical protein JWM91_877 [Rhodospirillales bacterium]|nr:hypothetical protein [Rhodospirillales bacterium]